MTTPNIYTAVMHTEHTKATGMNPLHLPIGLSDRKLRRNSFTSSYGAFLSSHAHVISDKISGVAADVILHLYNDHKEKKERHHERRSSSSIIFEVERDVAIERLMMNPRRASSMLQSTSAVPLHSRKTSGSHDVLRRAERRTQKSRTPFTQEPRGGLRQKTWCTHSTLGLNNRTRRRRVTEKEDQDNLSIRPNVRKCPNDVRVHLTQPEIRNPSL
ncbi:hypothetical protein G7K_3740-t1 [Saitoella complicata NRRL Y-17804]|uniref:Uncharacterized protein n=1 Tax=Saitoella complicata (strain BCRC 22490 / CBS 7301 / JCM 7358 / NBRC 10748 / NRRL Y-17804) TaxID=698492 RepID=A0A0E9NIT5_SAICN|nr:hypothetical protein G7K_3740-t1 [Saitoella complicata NRRL Y-17804]